MSNFVSRLFSKKTLVAGILLGTAALAAVVPTMAYAYQPSPSVSGVTTTWSSGSSNLRFSGSTTCFPIIAHALGLSTTSTGGIGTSGPFQTANGGTYSSVAADIECLGSDYGWADCGAQASDIGLSSRVWKSTDASGLTAIPFARDGIVMIVNASVNVSNLTKDQIRQIYNAKVTGGSLNTSIPSVLTSGTTLNGITDWHDINSSITSGTPIVAFARESTSGTWSSFKDNLKSASGTAYNTDAETATVNSTRATTSQDMVDKVKATPNSIGYVGVGYTDTLNPAEVKSLTLGGIAATDQNVTLGNYGFSRYLYLIVNPSATDPNVTSHAAAISAFKDYMLSPAGQNIVKAEGYVKLVPDTDITGKMGQDSAHSINISDVGKIGLKWGFCTAAYQSAHSTYAATGTIQSGDFADITNDGVVNISDVGKIGLWWGSSYSVQSNSTSGSGTAPTYP